MDLQQIKNFLKKYFFDFLFYSYLFKLSFLTETHTKAEIYIGTLLSFVLVCIKIIDLKENNLKEEMGKVENKVQSLANSLNMVALKVEKLRKFVDQSGTRESFESMKNPFNLKSR